MLTLLSACARPPAPPPPPPPRPAGREFGAKARLKQKKTGGLSNREKTKRKRLPFAARSGQVRGCGGRWWGKRAGGRGRARRRCRPACQGTVFEGSAGWAHACAAAAAASPPAGQEAAGEEQVQERQELQGPRQELRGRGERRRGGRRRGGGRRSAVHGARRQRSRHGRSCCAAAIRLSAVCL